ncbi:MAG: NAD(P)-dependent oxidoreductase [Clostridia bacterium]|nr:NAD(P)-dependent oxidoreductase [Clostridia bacterium]
MKKVIVTGANGFVGGSVVRELINNGIEVLALDLPGNNLNIPESSLVKFMGVDVFDLAKEVDKIKKDRYDTFYHFAWVGSAGPARVDYDLQMKNARCTVECVKIAKQLGCIRFVCAGSIMEKEVIAALEAQGNKPGIGYVYGMGKLMAHCLSKSVAAAEGIDLIWAIITNAYGEGELSPRFVNTTIRKIISGEPLQFTAATQGYDFVHIEDVARAFRLIGENGKPFCEYVIGSGEAKPLKNFIIELRNALAPEKELIFGDIPFTGIDMSLETFSTKHTEDDCGFKAQISFTEGVRRTMDWLKEQEI